MTTKKKRNPWDKCRALGRFDASIGRPVWSCPYTHKSWRSVWLRAYQDEQQQEMPV